MSDTQILRCNGGHSWTRPSVPGRPPTYCPDHANRQGHSGTHHAEAQRRANHGGSEVTAAEVIQWVHSLGLDIHPTLKGRVADILIDRYNREHPDRQYTRGIKRGAA